MALISCPDCAKQISGFAESCPSCGYPIKPGSSTNIPNYQLRNCPDCVQGQAKDTCGGCNGSGAENCYLCNGEDRISKDFRDVTCTACNGNSRHTCGSCAGHGYIAYKCQVCGGTGQLTFVDFDILINKRQEEARQKAEVQARLAEQRRAEEQKQQKLKEENGARLLREKQIRAKWEETERALKEQRIHEKLYVVCGRPLALFEKFGNKQSHSRCL